MNNVIQRNHYDVTDRVFVADPRTVCEEVCSLLRRVGRNADLRPVEQAFDAFCRLYAGKLPGYLGCEIWYHDAQHSLDCALVMARLLDGHESGAAAAERLGVRRAQLGVIVALFHDAGYFRNVGPLRVILGLQPPGDAGIRPASRPPSYKRRMHAGAVDPRILRTNVIAGLLRHAAPRVLMMAPDA